MTQTTVSAPTELFPTDSNASGAPYVNPIFESHFRAVERLLHKGQAKLKEVSGLLRGSWESNENPRSLIQTFERRLSLQFLLAEMLRAKPLLDKSFDDMSRRLDSRFRTNVPTDCEVSWLQDGVRINVFKARSLLDAISFVIENIQHLLEDSTEAADEARKTVTKQAEAAAYGRAYDRMDFIPVESDEPM